MSFQFPPLFWMFLCDIDDHQTTSIVKATTYMNADIDCFDIVILVCGVRTRLRIDTEYIQQTRNILDDFELQE